MDDRELLELAAKVYGGFYSNGALWVGREVIEYEWTPFTDDGQALRLAVKIGMVKPSFVMVFAMGTGDDFQYSMTATRDAIVCAAAEIGKSMQ